MPASLPAHLIILRHSPFGSSWTAEGLDIALVAASFGARVALFCCDDGVFNLVKGQQRGSLGEKAVLPTLKALELYDIDEVYVDEASLQQRGLGEEQLALDIEFESLGELLPQFERVLNF